MVTIDYSWQSYNKKAINGAKNVQCREEKNTKVLNVMTKSCAK